MIYFLLGEDSPAKDAKMAAWKQEYLALPEAHNFDLETVYSTKCDPAVLKKSLVALPAVSKKRLVIVRDIHKLSEQNQNLITQFAASDHEHLVLILESAQWEPTHSFVKGLQKISPSAKVVNTGRPEKQDVFDMSRAIGQRKSSEALKILSDLLDNGDHPLKIMGGLVWFWGSERPRMSRAKFEEGLLALGEADLNIKRSRLKPEQAVELLVAKLCAL